MGTDDGTVDNEVSHVWIIHEMLMHPFPDALIAPAGKAFIDAIPVAIGFWQQPPLGAAPCHPEDGFDEALASLLLPYIDSWAGAQELEHPGPLVIS